MCREIKIQHPTIPCIDFKGVISSLNPSLFVINSFGLILSKIVFPPSPFISYSSKDFSKETFDLELPFWTQLSQSENQCFGEMGFIENISKHKSPFSCVFRKHSLHDIHNFNENLFDDLGICVFDLGGTRLSKLWVLNNSLDLRTDPLQEGGDDDNHLKGPSTWANDQAHLSLHVFKLLDKLYKFNNMVKLVNSWVCISFWVTTNKSRSPNLQATRGDFATLCPILGFLNLVQLPQPVRVFVSFPTRI